MCLKPVVHVATHVLLEQCERMYFCCYASRVRVAAGNGLQIISFPSPPPKFPNTCILGTSNRNALEAKLSNCLMPFRNPAPNTLGLLSNRQKAGLITVPVRYMNDQTAGYNTLFSTVRNILPILFRDIELVTSSSNRFLVNVKTSY